LKLHNKEKRVREINFAASAIAKECADKFQETKFVAGSVGPTGELFEPLGLLTYDDAVEIFHEQMDALKSGGVDLIWIETISALDELKAALDAASRTGLPMCCTLSFDTHGSTMMGVDPKTFVRFCEDNDLTSYGANCGVGPSEIVDTILQIKKHQNNEIPIIAKGNCGIPSYQEGKIVYSGTPEIMSAYALMAFKAGAKIIGGCCGTTPLHIREMRNALEKAPISASYSINEHFAQLGRPWHDTDKSKKRIKRSNLRNRNS
jgi:5-methyltetrahydrofolate--homocysteine methyltransferase